MHLSEMRDLLRRRWGLIRGLWLASLVYAALLALSQPDLYGASETRRFELPASASAEPFGADLEQARTQVSSRAGMLDLIAELHLFGGRPDLSADELVALLGEAITIEIFTGRAGPNTDWSVQTTALMPSALAAARVARDLSQRLADAAIAQRTDRLARARELVAARDAVLSAETAELLQRAADAKAAVGQVPHAVQDRLRRIQAERTALSERLSALDTLLRTRVQVETVAPAHVPAVALPDSTALILVAGVFGGLALGLLAALAADAWRPVLRSARQMERQTGLAPMACIPVLETAPTRRTSWQRIGDWLNETDGPGDDPSAPSAAAFKTAPEDSWR